MLKSKFDVEEGVDMDIISCVKASDINPEIPLLILCIQASRLGTAVTSTVHGLDCENIYQAATMIEIIYLAENTSMFPSISP